VLETVKGFWKLASKMCESTFSMMKQLNLKTEIEWEVKHCMIVSEKPQPQASHW